jgi:PrcB C-terminal
VNTNRAWVGLILSMAGSGCSSASVAVTEVLKEANCTSLEAGIHAVTLEDVAKLKGRRMIGSIPPPPIPSGGAQRFIAISRGEQPTAGYGLELISASTATGDEIEVIVHWREPSADAVVAQVITKPCLVLGLPDAATGSVSVSLDDGSLLGSLPAIH